MSDDERRQPEEESESTESAESQEGELSIQPPMPDGVVAPTDVAVPTVRTNSLGFGRHKGMYPGDHLRMLCGARESELRKIAKDNLEPASKRAAAKHILDALSTDDKIRYRSFLSLLDRTEGKPQQAITVDHRHQVDPIDLLAELRRKFTRRVDSTSTDATKRLPAPGNGQREHVDN